MARKTVFYKQDLWDFGVWLSNQDLKTKGRTIDEVVNSWLSQVEKEGEAEIQNNMREE